MYEFFFKRLLDIIISLIFLPFLLLLVIVVGLLIYIEDGGPIFYKAPRLGKNSKIFKMYKFRSMKINAPDLRNIDGSTFNSNEDERVTKVGSFLRKSSIDEIPQIINVIIGEMSLVGPRPDLPDALELYGNISINKTSVKPGITGYNQAYFRNSIPAKQRLVNDLYYIDNISLGLDIKIVLKTIYSVSNQKNINNSRWSE